MVCVIFKVPRLSGIQGASDSSSAPQARQPAAHLLRAVMSG